MRKSVKIELKKDERAQLKKIIRSRRSTDKERLRATVILACDKGKDNKTIAQELAVNVKTASKWRRRFAEARLNGLLDHPRTGPKRKYDEKNAKRSLDITHWAGALYR